jgi:hypothetical protein
VTVLLLSISIFSAIYLFDRKDSSPAAGDDDPQAGGLLIDRIADKGRQEQREQEIAEKARQQAKIQASETELSNRPKFSNISFFLNSPYRGHLAIPESWQGKVRAEESERTLGLVYASSSGQTAEILSVRLFNSGEWAADRRQGGYRTLEELPGFVFAYRDSSGAGLPKNEASEFRKIKEMLPDIIKSFKSQKQ